MPVRSRRHAAEGNPRKAPCQRIEFSSAARYLKGLVSRPEQVERQDEAQRPLEPKTEGPGAPPYEPPEIEHLGSLKDLLGKSGATNDAPPFGRRA